MSRSVVVRRTVPMQDDNELAGRIPEDFELIAMAKTKLLQTGEKT